MPIQQTSLEAIAAEVRSCTRCRLSASRTHACPGDGTGQAEVYFIGEGPGYHEDQQGRPFVGAAGQLLNEMLRLVELDRASVFITNVVRCRPPGNRDPLPDELAACDDYTVRQLAALQPKLIVTLGRYSMARFFGPGTMRDLHGRTTTWNGITCLALYHPAAVLRANSPAMRELYEQDFRKIPPLLERARRQEAPTVVQEERRQPDQLRLF
jgi:uracil-DNA glycosylase